MVVDVIRFVLIGGLMMLLLRMALQCLSLQSCYMHLIMPVICH